MTCEICGDTRTRPTRYNNVFGMGADLVQCLGCGARFYAGTMGDERFYTSPAYDEYVRKSYVNGSPFEQDAGQVQMYRDVRWGVFAAAIAELASFAGGYGAGGKCQTLFEVGAAWGEMLLVARSMTIEVSGCDASTAGPEIAKKHDVDVQSAVLQDATMPENLDAVIMWDMIEHTFTPGADLRKVFAHLRSGGALLLKTFYEEWHFDRELDLTQENKTRGLATSGQFAPNAHPYHFTSGALCQILLGVGFELRKVSLDSESGLITVYAVKP